KNVTEIPPREEGERGEPLQIGLHQAAPPVLRSHDLEIVNLSEVLAYEMMGEVMSKLNVCDCKICQADVLALTLNRVQQKYITTDAGKQYMQLDLYRKQYETDLLSALTKACVRVKGSPRHK
ncbi:MAG: late competence development ComFB family protein, partial [Firmicutes bacterium]|nr:late competence development ComFB family protein [Bacillota bacterium]